MATVANPLPVSAKPSVGRAWFCVTVLSLAGIVSYIDRQIINLMVEPIKTDLGVSDLQMSLLQGFSFALFYAMLAIPLAWFADRHNRKLVILFGLVCWSAATFTSGLASVFLVLFLARMLIGVGEATLSPAGFSMISDYFPKERLPGPISVFTGAGFVGSGLALLLGGIVYSYFEGLGELALPFGTFAPWQMTFMSVAMLSIPVFVLLLFVAEPERREGNAVIATAEAPPTFEVLSFLKRHAKVFFPLFFGLSCFAGAQYGIGAWAPSYFIRVHEWTQLEVGRYFGPVVMLGGVTGVIAGGMIAEKLLKTGSNRATLTVPVMAILCTLPFAIAFPLVSSPFVALALLAVVIFLGTVPFGAGVSTFPLITPNRMRAQVVAFYLLVANLLGYSAGPIFIAWLTDKVFADPAAINLSLAIAPPLTMATGILFILFALKPYQAMAQSLAEGE